MSRPHVHFSLSPIPRIHLWLGHYSRHFQCCSRAGVQCCSRGGLVLFQGGGGAVLLQRGSSAAPEREGQCSFSGGLVLLQRECQCCSRRGSEQFRHGGSRAVPEGGQSCSRGRPNAAPEGVRSSSGGDGSTSGTQWTAPVPIQPCPLLRGYVLTQAIDIFHVLYLLYLLMVKAIGTPSFSTGRGRGEVAGATPLFRVSFGPGPPLQWTLRGPVQHSPRGGRSRQVIPAGRLGFRRNDPV